MKLFAMLLSCFIAVQFVLATCSNFSETLAGPSDGKHGSSILIAVNVSGVDFSSSQKRYAEGKWQCDLLLYDSIVRCN
jgi:hypothetical protein